VVVPAATMSLIDKIGAVWRSLFGADKQPALAEAGHGRARPGRAVLISRRVPSLPPLLRARAPCVENKNKTRFCLLRAPGAPIERHWVATPPPE